MLKMAYFGPSQSALTGADHSTNILEDHIVQGSHALRVAELQLSLLEVYC
jgi:hypothetical protein